MPVRPTRESLHMMTAMLWSKRGLCKLSGRDVGAVITTADMRQILAIGYNGPPRGMANDACRGTREIPDGRICGCVHAEANAIAQVDGRLSDKVMFVTLAPCEVCAALLIQANIKTVFYHEPYRNMNGIEVLEKCNVQVSQYQITAVGTEVKSKAHTVDKYYDPSLIVVRSRISGEI